MEHHPVATILSVLSSWILGVSAIVQVGGGGADTPTSILVAFIAISMSSLGLLGWVLRESIKTNRKAIDRLSRINMTLMRICDKLQIRVDLESKGEGSGDDE